MTCVNTSMQAISLWQCLILPFPLVHLHSSIIIKSEGETWRKAQFKDRWSVASVIVVCQSLLLLVFTVLSSHRRGCQCAQSSLSREPGGFLRMWKWTPLQTVWIGRYCCHKNNHKFPIFNKNYEKHKVLFLTNNRQEELMQQLSWLLVTGAGDATVR